MKLVLLPGLDGSSSLRAEFAEDLAAIMPCEVVSYPSVGCDDYPAAENAARAALPGEGQFLLMGESFSGPLAISIAASKPPGLIGVVLCASFARNPHPLLSFFWPLAGIGRPAWLVFRLLSELLLDRWSTRDRASKLGGAVVAVSPQILRARLRAVHRVDVSRELASLNVPLLAIVAEHDRVVPSSAAAHVQTIYPRAKAVTVAGPHSLLQANPVGVVDAIREFSISIDGAR